MPPIKRSNPSLDPRSLHFDYVWLSLIEDQPSSERHLNCWTPNLMILWSITCSNFQDMLKLNWFEQYLIENATVWLG